MLESIMTLFPPSVTATVSVHSVVFGPDAFSVDDRLLMGTPAPLRNVCIAAGLNSHGIMFSGGLGDLLASYVDWSLRGDTQGVPLLERDFPFFPLVDVNRVTPEVAMDYTRCRNICSSVPWLYYI